jgi:arylsulfatase A-like enzyme
LYGEQVQFLAGQIDKFLEGLKETGLYDTTTIIIHGDHGSRLRLLKSSSEQLERLKKETVGFSWLNRYDYEEGEPEFRDLLNRFATLLAIKLPGSHSSQIVTEPGSALYFLERALGQWSASKRYDAVNSVYLFNVDGSPRGIPMADLWRRVRTQSSKYQNGGSSDD